MFQFLVTVSQLCTDLEEDEAGDEEEDGDDGAHDDLHVEGWQVDHYRDRLLLHQHREVPQVVALAHSPVMESSIFKITVSKPPKKPTYSANEYVLVLLYLLTALNRIVE